MSEPPEEIRQLLRGIGIRAAVVGIGGLIVTGGTAVLAMRAPRVATKVALGATLLVLGSGAAAYEMKRAQRVAIRASVASMKHADASMEHP